MPLNDSAVAEYRKDLNAQSTARGYLITVMDALPVTTLNSIKLQSTCLSQLTEATNQLSRAALVKSIRSSLTMPSASLDHRCEEMFSVDISTVFLANTNLL